MFLYIIVISCVTIFILLRWRNRKVYRLSSKLKNDLLCLPLIGHAYLLMGNDEEVADPIALEVIMKTCLEKDDIMSIAHDLFGNGSIFAPVTIWRPRRKVLAPIFSLKNLNQFVEVFFQQASVMVDQLKPVVGKGTFPLWKYVTTYTMDSVCETTLGVLVGSQQNPNQPFLDAFDQHCQMSSKRFCLPPIAQRIYKFMPIYTLYMKHIHCMWEFVDKVIKNKRKEIKEKAGENIKENNNKEKERKTFLELYIESSGGASGFTNLELREESLVLLLAGTDTSAVGSAFTCLMLARHPEIQNKVYAEVQEVYGSSNRSVTAEDLCRLKYLEAVIKESLRLYPPVPVILRKSKTDITLPNGLEFPKNTSFAINIWAVHRNPVYWGADSEEFRPERFLNQEVRHPAAFIPFSYGPRSCLGYKYAMMSMQTSVAMLVRHYRLSNDGDLIRAPLRVKFDIMLKDVDNFELQLEARNK